MRHRRPDSVCESCVTVKRVRIGRSICCRTLPPNRGPSRAARRGGSPVLLTALAAKIIDRIDRHNVAVDEVLDDTGSALRLVGYAYTPVFVCALASSHANTSVRL